MAQVRGGKLATAEGVSYLEAKHLLLLHYCINIVFYLLLKAEGRPVRDHPVIARLLELRAYLEKIRPIDKKLQYQMEKLLMVAQLQVGCPYHPLPSPSPFPFSHSETLSPGNFLVFAVFVMCETLWLLSAECIGA